MTQTSTPQPNFLVLGATGKTGRRVAVRLQERGLPVRLGSRTAAVPFDWTEQSTWAPVLAGIDVIYLAYQPDLAVPGAPQAIQAFTKLAKATGVRRLVLVSGRGEPEAEECEQIVANADLEWSVVRCSWFAQNFDEGHFLDYILEGTVALPAGDVPEPFVDADDIADVAVAALTEDGHSGQIYELTGPRALTFAQAADEIGRAAGRRIDYIPISRTDLVTSLTEYHVPADMISLLDYLFGTILDGRNSTPTDGVRRALGREPKDFAAYAEAAAETGVWTAQTADNDNNTEN